MTFPGGEAVDRAAPRLGPESGGDGIERVGKVAPRRTGIAAGVSEGPRRSLPAGDRRLSRLDLLRAHPFEEVVPRVVLADVLQTQQAPAAGPVEVRRAQRRPKLSRL